MPSFSDDGHTLVLDAAEVADLTGTPVPSAVYVTPDDVPQPYDETAAIEAAIDIVRDAHHCEEWRARRFARWLNNLMGWANNQFIATGQTTFNVNVYSGEWKRYEKIMDAIMPHGRIAPIGSPHAALELLFQRTSATTISVVHSFIGGHCKMVINVEGVTLEHPEPVAVG